MTPRLHIIAPTTETQLRAAEEPPVHIGDLIRADVATRDWRAMHIAADRRQPIALGDSRKGGWLMPTKRSGR